MAVTLTAIQLAQSLRLIAGDTLPEPLDSIIQRLLAACTALVESYAEAAPDAVKNEAVVRLAGYLYEAAPGRSYANGMDLSGARSLLAPYRTRRAAALPDASDQFATPVTPSQGDGGAGGGLTETEVNALIAAAIAKAKL